MESPIERPKKGQKGSISFMQVSNYTYL